MKKTIWLAAIVMLATTSCKKTYTCECTTVNTTSIPNQPNEVTTDNFEESTFPVKKKDAKKACENMSATTSASFFNVTSTSQTTCKLK